MRPTRAENTTRKRIANELKKGVPLSKYDLEVRCFVSYRNVNSYLKIMWEEGEIHIAGYRRDSPHGSPTTMWTYGSGADAKKPKPQTQAQKTRKYRQNNPEAVIKEIKRKRVKRYLEKSSIHSAILKGVRDER